MESLYTSSSENLKKCVNVRNVVLSVIALLVGGALAYYSTVVADSTISSLVLCVGSIIIICALYCVFFRAMHWVYAPTHSAMKADSVSYEAKRFEALWNSLSDEFGFSRLRSTAEQSAIRMDYIYSVDGKFAALQLFQYSSLLYSPITEVYILKGDDAGRFIDRINRENK